MNVTSIFVTVNDCAGIDVTITDENVLPYDKDTKHLRGKLYNL